jgi:L-alanine-DL-glutamate epimerase-like enolase superfamily enzyme
MKITRIEILAAEFPFLPSSTNSSAVSLGKWETCLFVIAKVYTDTGLIGYGESAPFARISRMGQMPVIDTLADYLAPAVIGMDPFQIQLIWKTMDRVCPDNPQAKGVIDMALYDLMGKATGMPAYNFMGGKVRDRIPLQAIVCIDSLENMKRESRKWIEQGFKTVRIKTGVGSLAEDINMIRQIRREIGDDIRLRIDPNQAYSLKEALRLIPVLEENQIEIYEQPVDWTDINGLAQINAATSIPVMAHESMANIYDVRELIARRAVSLFTLKTDRPGGITKALLTRDVAELNNIPSVVMSSIELSISTCASMQLAATLKTMPFACEASGGYSIEDIADNTGRIVNGEFVVPDGPGFGVEVDEERLQYYTKGRWVCDASSPVKD